MTTDVATNPPSENLIDQERIDQRLDAIDRALLGLLSRNERLEIVGKVEARILELAGRDPGVSAALQPASLISATPVAARLAAPRTRSRLALAAGILGIVSLAALATLPLTYVVLATCEEILNEIVAAVVLGGHTLVVALAGTLAAVGGLVAIVRLINARPGRVGHGWAITGLCTGPVPMLIGSLLVLLVGAPLLVSSIMDNVNVSMTSPGQVYASAPASGNDCMSCTPVGECIAPIVEHSSPELTPLAIAPSASPPEVTTVGSAPGYAAPAGPYPTVPATAKLPPLPLAESRSSLPAIDNVPALAPQPLSSQPLSPLPTNLLPKAEPAGPPTPATPSPSAVPASAPTTEAPLGTEPAPTAETPTVEPQPEAPPPTREPALETVSN